MHNSLFQSDPVEHIVSKMAKGIALKEILYISSYLCPELSNNLVMLKNIYKSYSLGQPEQFSNLKAHV